VPKPAKTIDISRRFALYVASKFGQAIEPCAGSIAGDERRIDARWRFLSRQSGLDAVFVHGFGSGTVGT